MLLSKILPLPLGAALALGAVGCTHPAEDPAEYQIKGSGTKSDASVEAVFVVFEFDGEVFTNFAFNPRAAIDDQLLYTIGHLNGTDSNGVGRLDKVQITNIQTFPQPDGTTRITYHAVLPAAWGHPDNVPDTHTFRLPRDISFQGQENFTAKYKEDCVDFLAHDVDSGIMWYYYRPNTFGCSIDPADVVEFTADVSLSSTNTTGKFPEYDKVWEDDTLEIVAIFGKNEAGTTSNDAGISAYNEFSNAIQNRLSGTGFTTEPAGVGFSPGWDNPDVTYTASLGDGKTIKVTAMLIDGVRDAPEPQFSIRYSSLTPTADLIAYAGHSGLGANIRALAQKGKWQTGQYAMIYMGGCDTYAYVDSALADAHIAVNPDDPNGTKYMDMITNAQPAFFHENADTIMFFVNGLLSYDEPQTYEQMFKDVDDFQVILVSGEEDNTFVPGGSGGTVVDNWAGFDASDSIDQDDELAYVMPDAAEGDKLAAGSYVFELTGDNDADLYVRVGQSPTTTAYDCRPYLNGSQETCVVELSSPAAIHVMVRGWAASSSFTVTGTKQ